MLRLRLLRVVLPVVFLLFLGILIVTLRPRRAPTGAVPDDATPFQGPRAEGIELSELWAGQRRLFLRAGVGRQDEKGRLNLEQVERVEIAREDGPPLILRAERGSVDGVAGHRVVRLEGGVEVRDEPAGLRLFLPGIEFDEMDGKARSLEALTFEGPGYKGRARSVVYGLNKNASATLESPEIEDSGGAKATAGWAEVPPGSAEIDLQDKVRVVRGTTVLDAERIRLLRGTDRHLRSAEAQGAIRCEGFPIAGGSAGIVAKQLRLQWDSKGDPEAGAASGDVEVHRQGQTLRAQEVEFQRDPEQNWIVVARGAVRVEGTAEAAPAELKADSFHGKLDAAGSIHSAEAVGRVRFQARGAAGEAARATFEALTGGGEATLYAGPREPARLARDRTRIAAQKILTDVRGTRLSAEGRVEATLMGAGRGNAGPGRALFEQDKAVHFVSARLDGESAGNRLVFQGSVRGWQGERNLSADRVEIDEGADSLIAIGGVTSRFPRDDGAAAEPGQYVQISADRLDYSGSSRRIVYAGKARVFQDEGWIEGDRLEVDLDDAGRKAREIRVVGSVRFEMNPTSASQGSGPVRGFGDRAIYSPGDHVLRLFGDTAPASVTRTGETGGTTTGRVLRYRLDAGTLEVESGGEGDS